MTDPMRDDLLDEQEGAEAQDRDHQDGNRRPAGEAGSEFLNRS